MAMSRTFADVDAFVAAYDLRAGAESINAAESVAVAEPVAVAESESVAVADNVAVAASSWAVDVKMASLSDPNLTALKLG